MEEIKKIQNELECIKEISLEDEKYNELYLALNRLLNLTIKIEKIRHKINENER